MLGKEVLDLLAHPRFISLTSVSGGWELVFLNTNKIGQSSLYDSTLDRLLDVFANIVED